LSTLPGHPCFPSTFAKPLFNLISMGVGYKPYLLLSVLPFTFPSSVDRIEVGDGEVFMNASKQFRDTTVSFANYY